MGIYYYVVCVETAGEFNLFNNCQTGGQTDHSPEAPDIVPSVSLTPKIIYLVPDSTSKLSAESKFSQSLEGLSTPTTYNYHTLYD